MGNKKRKNTTSFLAQGTILAAASLISRVIGLIYRMPLTAIIGDTGNDYYGSAYTIYNILLIISSYSLPLAVSKLVSANISQGRRRNVYRILKCALIFALVSPEPLPRQFSISERILLRVRCLEPHFVSLR